MELAVVMMEIYGNGQMVRNSEPVFIGKFTRLSYEYRFSIILTGMMKNRITIGAMSITLK